MSNVLPNAKYPTVYVLSQIPRLTDCLQKVVPTETVIKNIKLKDEFDRNLKLNSEQKECVKDAEILLVDNTILRKIMYDLPKIIWVHSTWAGVEGIFEEITNRKLLPPFLLTRHSGKAFGITLAEYVVCQILNCERQISDTWKAQTSKTWIRPDRFIAFRTLDELTVGVLGVGNMGSSVARFLKQRGATVFGLAKNSRSAEAPEHDVFDRISVNLTDILPECDYLCNTLPSTPETCGLLNGPVFKMCNKRPIFINVGRGNIIKEDDLINALKNEWISGAVLDVFENEPLDSSSELWNIPQVLITPHIAAVSKPEHIVEEFILNYNRFSAGEKLHSSINWSAGY